MRCRHCSASTEHAFLDLGYAPPSNAYLTNDDLSKPERHYPLRVKVCDRCWLVQTEDFADRAELFSAEYAYFSSTSISWLAHAAQFQKMITQELGLNANSLVLEIASNDGYLLRNFVECKIPCLGVEPTRSTAATAEKLGIPVLREFFGEALGKKLASQSSQADLIVGNNVFAHVPDINDFTRGLKAALKMGGTITLEFPHLMRLLENCQFDTVYHEHFSYLSLNTVDRIFSTFGLRIWRVEELGTHGGSLRVFGCHDNDERAADASVAKLLIQESLSGMQTLGTYSQFQEQANAVKDKFLAFLISLKRAGKSVAGYGAAAKGNTLLNYAGVKPDLLPMICDAALAKQGKFMPGSHIPVLSPDALIAARPDFVLILPWNLAKEIRDQLNSFLPTQTKFVTAIPELEIV